MLRIRLVCCATGLVLLDACALAPPADDWTRFNTIAELSFQTVNAIDAFQTARIRGRHDLREGEPITRAIIGEKPSPGEVATYFGAMAVSHYLISRALPPKWRPWFQVVTVGYEGRTVWRNCYEHDLCPP